MLGNLQHIGPRIKEVAEEMRGRQITGTAGDGAVQVVINGIGKMQDVQISDLARSSELLPTWVQEATNQAGAEAKRQYAAAIHQVANDLNLQLPGLEAMLASLTEGA